MSKATIENLCDFGTICAWCLIDRHLADYILEFTKNNSTEIFYLPLCVYENSIEDAIDWYEHSGSGWKFSGQYEIDKRRSHTV